MSSKTQGGLEKNSYGRTVTMFGYVGQLHDGNEEEKRGLLDGAFSRLDFTGFENREIDNYKIVVDGEKYGISRNVFEAISNADSGDVKAVNEPDRETERKHDISRAAYTAKSNTGTLKYDYDIPDGIEADTINRLEGPHGELVVRLRSGDVTTMRMLKEGDNIDGTNIYVDDDAEYLVVSVMLYIEGADPVQKEWFDNDLLPQAKERFRGVADWEAVRFAECEEETTKVGVCSSMVGE